MTKYEKYKDSGISWIGEIPAHWETCRLKAYNSLSGRIGWNGLRSDEFLQEGYAYLVTGQDFDGPNIQWDKCYQIDRSRYDEDPFIQLKNGDLLITKDGTIGKIAKVSGLDKPACLNSGIFVMKQTRDKYDQNYLYWLLVSSLLKDYNAYTSTGTTIQHLYQNVFVNMPMLVPPKKEQKAIADYLDAECKKIDDLISKDEKRVSLLKEARLSIISKAVIRGLNDRVKLTPCKHIWLGSIPEHWEIKRGKYVTKLLAGFPFNSDLFSTDETDMPLIRIRDIMNTSTESFYSGSYSSAYIIRKGDVLVGMDGDFNIAIWNGPDGLLNQRVCKVEDVPGYSARYAYYVLPRLLKCINDVTYSTTVKHLSTFDIYREYFPVPPIKEQKAIADYLDKKCAEYDRKINKVNHRIDLLQEYKQSIITEVVTGKRKVY